MPAYTVEQWEFIVGQLAAYVSPKTIVAEFALRWPDTACQPADILHFQRDNLPPDWQDHFDREREAFLDPPTKDSAVRVAELHRMFVSARDRGATDLAAKLLQQIETSTGGVASSSSGGGPVSAIELIVVDPKPLPESAQ